jgi:hypothetical protein
MTSQQPHSETGRQTQHNPVQQEQQSVGQQSPQQGQQMLTQQPQSDGTIEQSQPQQMHQARQQFNEAAKVCEWCAERCAGEGPQMAECIRLCRDVADIASMNARFIARDSPYGPDLAQVFIAAAQECAQECSQHSHAHCQACAQTLRQSIQSTQQMLQSLPAMNAQ